MVGHLTAALDPDDLDAAAGQRFRVGADVGRVGRATEGQDRRVLEQEQLVGDGAVGPLRREALLERQSVAVVGASEP